MSLKKKLIHFSGKFDRNTIDYSYPLDYFLPVYHSVSNDDQPHLKHIIKYKSVEEFEKELDLMLRYFDFVDWDNFKKYQLGEKKAKKKIALLTFDDGLRDFYDIVAPLLEKKGVFAINFINPQFIDNKDLMFRCKASLIIEELHKSERAILEIGTHFKIKNPTLKSVSKKINLINYLTQSDLDVVGNLLNLNFNDFLNSQKPYLSTSQLESLHNRGFGIAAHSWDHPLYFELSHEDQINTTTRSIRFIEERKYLSECFAFPFTDFGIKKDFFEELFAKTNLFCSFGSAGIKTDSFERNYQRVPMETGEPATEILKDQIAYYKLKRLFYKNRIHRK